MTRCSPLLFLTFFALLNNVHNLNMTFSQYYDAYASKCGKSYNASENATRQGYFDAAAIQIDSINSQGDYTAGVNCFTDWSEDELRSLTEGLKELSNPTSDDFSQFSSLSAQNVDWRSVSGAVSSIKDQGDCSSAWAFAITAMCESSVSLKEAEDLDLSEQYILECTTSSSCDGGYLEYAMQSAVYDGGIPLQSQYSYDPSTVSSGICSANDITFISESLYDFYDLNATQIKKLLSRGPVAVSLSSNNWEFYEGGIFKCASSDPVDHAALLVGVQTGYWIVKNSWGISWGQNGYIRISTASSQDCGIGTSVHMLWEVKLLFALPLLLLLMIFL